jgi:hydroxylamine reductase
VATAVVETEIDPLLRMTLKTGEIAVKTMELLDRANTDMAEALPKDTVILTAGCAKYRYNKLDLGDIGGIPRVLDAGQCNDSYSLAVTALRLKEAFEIEDINDLPIDFDIAWYEQKAVAVLLALLSLGFKGIRIGPSLAAITGA